MHPRLLILILLFTASPSYAGMRINDFSSGGTSINFNNWSGSGSSTIAVSFCVTSVIGRTRTSTIIAPYEIKLRTRNSPSNTPFQLEATSGNDQRLPVTVTYSDLLGTASEQLLPNTYTAQDKQGETFQCPQGLNASLQLVINRSDLAIAAAGNYQARLRIVARGGDNGTERQRKNMTINITVDDIVKLQGMDDLLLGNYSGNGDVSATESFCVYSNGSGAYQVTANGNGNNGDFALLSNGTAVPYSVEWNDGSSVSPVSANSNLTQRQNATSDVTTCSSGGSNASINIRLLEADLNSSPAGNYRGTLTLIIAPE